MTPTDLITRLADALELVMRQIGDKFEPTADYVERTIDLHGDECQRIKEALTEARAHLASYSEKPLQVDKPNQGSRYEVE